MDALATAMRELKRVEPNSAIGLAALLLDMGASTVETGVIAAALIQTMLFANAIEAAHQASDVLQCLPTEYVDFRGRPPRVSPREMGSTMQAGASGTPG
jgi:hypothetical protein